MYFNSSFSSENALCLYPMNICEFPSFLEHRKGTERESGVKMSGTNHLFWPAGGK